MKQIKMTNEHSFKNGGSSSLKNISTTLLAQRNVKIEY